MNNEVYNVNEAYLILKEGIKMKDTHNALFYLKGTLIRVIAANASYLLTKEDFLRIYEKSSFLIDEDKETTIDPKKDEEYYNFKHK